MKKIIFLLFLVVLASCKGHDTEKIINVEVGEFKTEVFGKDVQLVDVRTTEEYNEGHIDDAINIDFFESDTFAENFAQFDKSEPLYIYCKSGNRSQKSSKILQEFGFKNIIELRGGYNAWKDEN